MHVDIGTVLHVLAHELRTPSGIAQGYLRMLLEDRLNDPADRRKALEQAQKALGRVTALTQESTALANWLEADRAMETLVTARELLDRVVRDAELSPAPAVMLDERDREIRLATVDLGALVGALSAVLKATARELKSGVCTIEVRSGGEGAVDLLIGAAGEIAALARGPEAADAEPLALERGGIGLSLVTAAFVLQAHRADGWTSGGSRTTVGIRFPLREEKDLQ